MSDKQQFQLGGQALIEGVMMRSPRFVGAAVRRADGSIETRVEPVHSVMKQYPVLRLPFVRGVVALFEMMALGMRFLNWSSNLALLDQKTKDTAGEAGAALMTTAVPLPVDAAEAAGGEATVDGSEAAQAQDQALPWWMFLATLTLSLVFGMALFVALPNLIADWTLRRVTDNVVALNLFEGLVKLAIFIAYVWLIGRKPDIRRVFEYHGAEHKVVYAVENDRPLTPEGARPFDTPHPRCGTGFALLTVLVSIICFSFLPWTASHVTRVAMRLALMPVVAGLSYEVIKMTAHPKWGNLAKTLMTPGLWLQRLTTRQPDDEQLEVSCVAMRVVLEAEEAAAQPARGTTGLDPVARPAAV